MMSILIKGMEMPKGCASCFLKYGSCASIRKRMDVSKGDRWCPENYRHPDCPLIEVPEDVQPLEYGEWTAEGNDEYGNYWDECTACRKAVWFPPSVKNDYKYCPHCGAKMDGET